MREPIRRRRPCDDCTAYIFVGAMADPARSGTLSPLREVMRIQDADHFSYEYYERHGGKEMLAVRLDYTRSR
jgi:hypothetical protein